MNAGHSTYKWIISSWNATPHSPVSRESLKQTVRSLLIATLALIVASAIWSPRRAAAIALGGFIVSFELGALWALRRGHKRVAKYLLLIGFTLPSLVLVLFDGTIHSGAMTALLGLVVMSAWLLGRRAALIGTSMLVVFIVGSAALPSLGIFLPKYFVGAPIPSACVQILIVVLTAVPLSNFLAALRSSSEHLSLTLSAADAVAWSIKIPFGAQRDEILRTPIFIREFPEPVTSGSIGETLSLVHPDEYNDAVAHALSCIANREVYRSEHRATSVSSGLRWYESWARPFEERDGVRFLGLTIDVTTQKHQESERAALEHKLLQTEKMDAIAKLVRGVTHELGNNLCVIMLQAGSMAQSVQDPEVRRQLELIVSTAEQGASITQRLAAFSKQSKPEACRLNLRQTLLDLESVLRHLVRPGVDFSLKLNSDSSVIMDPVHLLQVVIDLVSNAQEAAPDGSSITLELYDLATRESGSSTGHVVLSVADEGPGIPMDVRDRIFEPFYTTKPEGRATGLGLSEVYGLVDQAFGRVEVESQENGGTIFKVILPITNIKSAATQG